MSQKRYESTKKNRRKQKQPWWPILIVLGGLVVLAGAFLALRGGNNAKAAIEVKGAPAVKVDQQQIDLGDVKLGRTVEATFTVTNVGDQTLRFDKAPYIEVVEGC